ncbi:type II toxin-antitoxin system ParD family antitoxin [Niveispirillum irakense]|uniref:type II toxin-antitoxin system ParD family antitoxin n=1 Tax=Niveispirillum irakense TaxID=34011 RepID=UPI000423BE2F|nr:type II toxin-antitoxin system ParD family antitoxin [Niveispirillum irakense]
MNVSLTPQLEAYVRAKVETGLYTSSSEVVREALRMMEQRERQQQEKLEALRRDIQEGLDSGSAGPIALEDMLTGFRRRMNGEV